MLRGVADVGHVLMPPPSLVRVDGRCVTRAGEATAFQPRGQAGVDTNKPSSCPQRDAVYKVDTP